MLPTITRIYEFTLLLAAVYAAIRFKAVNTPMKYFCVLIWLEALTEGLGNLFIWKYHTNIPVYNLSSLFEFLIFCVYFGQININLRKNKIEILIALIGLVFFSLNTIYLQPFKTLSSNFLFFEWLMITCLCLYSIFQMLFTTGFNLTKEVHFWIVATFLFYQCGCLFNWGIYNYMLLHPDLQSIYTDMSLLLINIIIYCSYFLILLFYPKMRTTDV